MRKSLYLKDCVAEDKNNQAISFVQLRKRASKIEENKVISKNSRILSFNKGRKTSNQSFSHFSPPNSVSTQINILNDSKFYKPALEISQKFLKLTKNPKFYTGNLKKIDSVLDLFSKSEKLKACMEKLGKPIDINDETLWSKEIQRRKNFFNHSVYNSCSLSDLMLESRPLKFKFRGPNFN